MSTYFSPISFTLWSSDKDAFAEALGRSFRETGFAVLTDHGIDPSVINTAIADTRAFFALSDTVKRAYFDPDGGGQRGYIPFGTENAKDRKAADLKEFWHTGRIGLPGTPHADAMRETPKVREIETFDASSGALYHALDQMGQSVLAAIARHLGLEETWFTPRVAHGNSILRLLHYPPQDSPPPPGSVRAAAHEDINVITLLLGAEEAGLEVKHRSGEWLAVNPPPGALVINVGDMLQRLTNGVLPSTTHRVVNPSAERTRHPRYSTPFFLHFAPDVLIEPLETCLEAGKAPLEAITAHDYLMERLREIGLMKP